MLETDDGQKLTERPSSCSILPTRNPAPVSCQAPRHDRPLPRADGSIFGSRNAQNVGSHSRPTSTKIVKICVFREVLGRRIAWLDQQLAGKQYIMGDKFTVADAYLFTVLRAGHRRKSALISASRANVVAYERRAFRFGRRCRKRSRRKGYCSSQHRQKAAGGRPSGRLSGANDPGVGLCSRKTASGRRMRRSHPCAGVFVTAGTRRRGRPRQREYCRRG